MPFDWRPPTLETERLILRALTVEDVDAVFAYASNPAVARALRSGTRTRIATIRSNSSATMACPAIWKNSPTRSESAGKTRPGR